MLNEEETMGGLIRGKRSDIDKIAWVDGAEEELTATQDEPDTQAKCLDQAESVTLFI